MEKKPLTMQLVTDVSEAQKLWESFCPQKTIYDAWQFRALFHKYHQKDIRFYVGYVDGNMVGVWPLQYNPEKKWIEFFGGDYMEDNRLFLDEAYEMYRSDFYEYLKTLGEAVHLECITGEDEYTRSLELQDTKYILPIQEFQHYDDYLQKYFSPETRRTFHKKIRRIEKLGVKIEKNTFSDLEEMFELNSRMFGDHSSFNDRPHHREIFRELIHLSEFQPHVLTFFVDGKKEGVSLSLLYRGCYAYVILGLIPEGVKDMSTFMNIQNIQHAIEQKANMVDCFVGAYGWKDRWHFTGIPQYKFFFGI